MRVVVALAMAGAARVLVGQVVEALAVQAAL